MLVRARIAAHTPCYANDARVYSPWRPRRENLLANRVCSESCNTSALGCDDGGDKAQALGAAGVVKASLGIMAASGKQLSTAEQTMIDKEVRIEKGTPMDALRKVNASRHVRGEAPVHKSNIYRYLNSTSHRRGAKETRGRPKTIKKGHVTKLQQARRRLIKDADSERPVTYEHVLKEAGLQKVMCLRSAADALRGSGIRFRRPREKVYLSKEDAKIRLNTAREWIRRPRSYWSQGVHAYVDNKAFPIPLTPKQRSMYHQTRVTGHLRTAKEGLERGFTKSKTKHTFLGVPSVTISAAVAKDKVIMWHALDKPWNGATAAAMYTGPLLKALRRTWGHRRQYTIVEDGDRKGNQSGKGLAAKEAVHIKAKTLPPRSPSWMPLDYAVWGVIQEKMHKCEPRGTESKADFLARLERCAKTLPRGLIRKIIGRMKGNIQGVIDSKGFHAKND